MSAYAKFLNRALIERYYKACCRLVKWRGNTGVSAGLVAKKVGVSSSFIRKSEAVGAQPSLDGALALDNYSEVWPSNDKRTSNAFKLIEWVEGNCGLDFIDVSQVKDLDEITDPNCRFRIRYGWRVKQFHEAFLTSPAAYTHLADLYTDSRTPLDAENQAATFAHFSLALMNTADKESIAKDATPEQVKSAEAMALEMAAKVEQLPSNDCAKTRHQQIKAGGYLGIGLVWIGIQADLRVHDSLCQKLIEPALRTDHPNEDGHWFNVLRLSQVLLNKTKNGKIFARINTRSREALAGFKSETMFVFRDKAGNVLYSVTTPKYGVNGEYVPGAAHSRTDTFEAELPIEVLVNTHQVDIFAGHNLAPVNPWKELKKIVDETEQGLKDLGVDPKLVFKLLLS